MTTSSVTAQPQYYSYANQLQGINNTNTTTPPSTSPAQIAPAATSNTQNTTQSQASSAVSQLLGGAAGGFSPEILSLLQNGSNGNFDPVSTLLGGTSTSNPFTPILTSLYSSAASAAVTRAKNIATPVQNTPNSTTGAALINTLISQQSDASVAYNAANVQAVQNTVATNSYNADGITPIVV